MSLGVKRNYRSVLDLVTSTLRELILDHTLKPNERLRQEDLAARLGVSRMPVRDALKQLEAEGLVLQTPRGAVVADMSPDVIWEDYVIRAALEGTATRLAVERIDEATLAYLEDVLDQLRQIDDHDEELKQADRFHETLYAASGMPRLCTMIRTLRSSCERYRRASLAVPGRSARATERRVDLLRASRAGDAEGAERIMRETILENAEILVRPLRGEGRWPSATGDAAPAPVSEPPPPDR
jgi:DNA-binding GntR family transcriptional regulator